MPSEEPKQTVLATVCVCLLVAVAFFAAYAGQNYSQAVPASRTAKNQSEANQDAYYQLSRSADEHAVAIGVATIIVGFVQAVALVVTFLIIAFVAVRQLRAYIYPGQILVKFLGFTEPMIITIDIRNSGTTPAKNLEFSGSVFLETFPLEDNTIVRKPSEPVGVDIASYRCIPESRITSRLHPSLFYPHR